MHFSLFTAVSNSVRLTPELLKGHHDDSPDADKARRSYLSVPSQLISIFCLVLVAKLDRGECSSLKCPTRPHLDKAGASNNEVRKNQKRWRTATS